MAPPSHVCGIGLRLRGILLLKKRGLSTLDNPPLLIPCGVYSCLVWLALFSFDLLTIALINL